ncbi:drug resistance transporter, EmrB/QacA subfamily [Streptoalloteichus hindustanus]|uniref:Drug resistance transporter, EmrB/QacA subfamily n=1 Tax=Streptoalloteichus hindustanus TaxID=2017 RepID=A0A1M5EWB5_STRHI|nr:drug resistance transporter, EmrB/QacA subfamily [Streptoalloteichus hindustanus]
MGTTPGAAGSRLDPDVLELGVAVVVGSIAALLDMTMVTVALAELARGFDASVTSVQWVSAAYLLAVAVVIPVTGRLVERFGARRTWSFALVAFLVGSVLCGLAWSIGSLIAFRAVQGLGGGMMAPLSMMIMARAVPPEQRGRVMAVVAVPGQLAPIVGPLLGGLAVDSVGWRWIFFVNVPVCLVALLLARRVPDGPVSERGARWLDLTGLLLLCPALALVVYGLSATRGRLPLLVVGAVLLVAFAAHALRARAVAPLLDLRLFAHRPFAAASALNFLSRFSIFGVLFLMPLYFQQARGHSALVAGLLLAPQSLGTMLALPQVGRLADRFGARLVVLVGAAITAVAALAYTRVGADTSDLVLGLSLLLSGVGVAAVTVPVSAAAYEGLPPTSIPGATSAVITVQTVGASVGAAVLASILHGRMAQHPGNPADAFADTFVWVLVLTLLTVVPTLLLPLRRGEKGKPVPSR